MTVLSVLSELDEAARRNLLSFVQRDLEREYPTKAKNKALKLPPAALAAVELSGERLEAQIREQGKVFRVDMTFPLFDLDTDYTLVKCSCQRDSHSLEPQRCHHLYFFQKAVADSLLRLEAASTPAEDPLIGLRLLLDEAESGDEWLKDYRQTLVFDPHGWILKRERQSRLRYEADAEWHVDGNETILADEGSAEALYDALQVAADNQETIYFVSGHEPIAIEESRWQLELKESGETLEVNLQLPEPSLRLLIPKRGYLCWIESNRSLLLIPVKAHEAQFLERLAKSRGFPLSQRKEVLELLARLDPRVFSIGRMADAPLEAARYKALLRLTPFAKGGMKVEFRVLLNDSLQLLPREGAEVVSDGKRRWVRDFQEESELRKRTVARLNLFQLPEAETNLWIAYNDHKALEIVTRLEEAKDEIRVEWPSFLSKKPYEMAKPLAASNLKVSVGEKKDWFSVEGWMELDDGQKISLRDLLKTLKRQGSYMRLPDGRWSLIPEHFRQRIAPLADSVEIEGDEVSIDIAALAAEDLAQKLEDFPFAERSKDFWRLVAKARSSQSLAIPLPQGLNADLRPYQKDGYRWMARLSEWGLGACLADDMGLGKTLQTLAVLLRRKDQGPSLVIAPSSLSYNWLQEMQRFTPDLQPILLRDLPERSGRFAPGQVVIASYGLVMRYAERLRDTEWTVMVLDEAQQIKNAQTKTAQAVQTLNARWTVALSGTPIENHLGDLWSLFRTISPGLFGEWERFRRAFVFPIEREGSDSAKQRLKHKIAPFVLRRMKKDYLEELPDKTEVDIWIDLSAEEQAAYDALRGEAVEKMQNLMNEEGAEQKKAIQVLAALTRLRQAACHRQLIDESWQGPSSKVEWLKEQLSELKEAGHAALVFSQFTRFLGLVKSEVEAAGLRALYLDGQTPVPERAELVKKFQEGAYDVFLISLKAGGTGLNLTRASYVFHLDPWWNPATENQATDRAYRMGQKNAVTVYRVRSRNTIEELIQAMHDEKRSLVEAVLEGRQKGTQPQWKELWNLLWPQDAGSVSPRSSRFPEVRSPEGLL